MSEFTVQDLMNILQDCAGDDEAVSSEGNVLDRLFEEIGFDSLTVLNSVTRIECDYSIVLPESVIADATTPRTLLKLINEAMSSPGSTTGE